MFTAVLLLASILWTTLAAITSDQDDDGHTYAVLIAGSATYMNYRHQADVCHAYHVLTDIGGIPEDNVIVMMADDIAYNSENPFQGNIINRPGGPNVYPGVPKHWTGKSVNAENFLRVLTGDGGPNEKVLRSGPNDKVFVYFADHGAAGMLGMPFGDPLMANNLTKALKTMHSKKMYNELVFYIEACESGSMFDGLLPPNMHIYGATASTPDQSSYACYYSESRQTYLGDLWSVSWIEDSEANMTKGETLIEQWLVAKARTTESNAQHYGDLSIDKEKVEVFEGEDTQQSDLPPPKYNMLADTVSSRDVRLEVLKHRWTAGTPSEKIRIQELIENEMKTRIDVEYTFRGIVALVAMEVNDATTGDDKTFEYWLNLHEKPTAWEDLLAIYKAFEAHCRKFDEYSLQFYTVLVSLVEIHGIDIVFEAIAEQCSGNSSAHHL